MLAGTAASAGSAVAQQSAASANANAAAKFQNQRYSSTAQIAMDNYLRSIGQTQLQLQQQTMASGQQAMQNHLAAQASEATGQTAAAESGIAGNSVAELLNDFARHEAANNANLHTQLLWQQQQAEETLRSDRAQVMGQIASGTPQPIQGPSPVQLGLNLMAVGANSFNQLGNYYHSQTPHLTNTQGP